jgi:hypothetical protein
MFRASSRRAAVLGPLLMALTLIAQPVAADQRVSESGDHGPYETQDTDLDPGAKCFYESNKTNGKNVLDGINIRPPLSVLSYDYGAGNPNQSVGWRYIIQRDSDANGTFSDLFKSSFVKDKANETHSAGFSRRTWYASENPQGNYRVRIVIRWYELGSSSVQSGKVVHQLDYYRAIKGSSNKERMGSCYRDWQGS